jgi:FkbM family methyltransferase
MLELIRRIAQAGEGQIGTVLHLGAGACREIDAYLRLKPAKVVLVEADPERASDLRAALRGLTQVEVVSAAVAPEEGETTLHVLNKPGESSLHAPVGLARHWPNLKSAREVVVKGITLAQAVKRTGANGDAGNVLVLELQGAEAAVLASVTPQILQKFAWIAARVSGEALYENGATLDEVDALLQQAGFRPLPQAPDESSWPFQNVLYARDERMLRLQVLELQTTRLAEEVQLARAQAARLAALEQALAEASVERERLVEEGSAERERLAKAEAQERRGLDEASAEGDRLAKAEAHARQELAEANAERDRLAKAEAHARRELAEARRSVALGVKLQALREADLRELQERYGRSLEIQEKQRELLLKLGARLSAAAGYFRELTSAETVLIGADKAPRRGGRRGRAGRVRRA